MTERQKRRYEKCRCGDCRSAANARRRAREHAKRETPIDQVDAKPVLEHVQRLRAQGIGFRRIARLAGVSKGTVEALVYGRPAIGQPPTRWMRSETARRLLAVTRPAEPEDTSAQRGSASRARNYASGHGWLPPMARDDDTIDVPEAAVGS